MVDVSNPVGEIALGDEELSLLGSELVKDGYKYIHVNRHVIDSNRKHGKDDPPIAIRVHSRKGVKTARRIVYGRFIRVYGETEFVYDNDNPLSCGARLWVQTSAPVRVWK